VKWWDAEPKENIFVEITNRSNIGSDLLANGGKKGKLKPGSTLLPLLAIGDLVIHYSSTEEAIVGISRVTSNPVALKDPGGWRVQISGYQQLSSLIPIESVRQVGSSVMQIRDDLIQAHRPLPVHFPFAPYGAGPIRPRESYIEKFPRQLLELFPSLLVEVQLFEGLYNSVEEDPLAAAAENAVADCAGKPQKRGGQGFQINLASKIAVEDYSMKRATQYWEKRGIVEDVHGNSSYDLVCTVRGSKKHIEVKGTTGEGLEILVTPNEVKHAKTYADVCLTVVSNIVVRVTPKGRIRASGGEVTVFDPWKINDGKLTAVGYVHEVPPTGGKRIRGAAGK
jgi:hypothetical protein